MSIDIYNTPLRYPGGKGKFAPVVKSIFEANGLVGGHYLEPYAGGAAVALDLLYSGFVTDIHINDIDVAVYSFWKSITKHTDEFLKLLHDTSVTIDEWHKQKLILNDQSCHDPLQIGFAAFFLNRTNRSGILKGGVIGGKKQDGNYTLDARFHKVNLSKRIEKVGLNASRIHVYNDDALDLIKRVDEFLPNNSLVYLDPPYYVKGQGLYRNFYVHDDHVKIRKALDKIKSKWIVSYDNCDEIKEIYKDYLMTDYDLNYSAYHKIKAKEVMFFCESLNTPQEFDLFSII
ncbi:DNA adenine methylase [Acinetobacter baumannii]|uniref:DNA adenine methylase n=1 Tax=Acinetobacter baumannii TaxID=470 RepID=UPI001FD66CD0|nr:DNA adenine methylase [Acinetobacter baumannii]MDN8320811.1 DNA adenine methylase [Acinetobacter baumannii]MDO7531879.1 DNA adenine methylase [Acinetobacter baumannii]